MDRPERRIEHVAENAKRFVRTLGQTLKGLDEVGRLIVGGRDKFLEQLPDDFSWSFLYEIPFQALLVLALGRT